MNHGAEQRGAAGPDWQAPAAAGPVQALVRLPWLEIDDQPCAGARRAGGRADHDQEPADRPGHRADGGRAARTRHGDRDRAWRPGR